MRTTTATVVLAALALVGQASAQSAGNSGFINRQAQESVETMIQPGEQVENEASTQMEPEQKRKISVSYDPADLDDTTGMDAYEVFTWTDRRGVRHYTDDRKKAPSSARTRNIYSMPPSTRADDPNAPREYEIFIEKEKPSDP